MKARLHFTIVMLVIGLLATACGTTVRNELVLLVHRSTMYGPGQPSPSQIVNFAISQS